MAGWVNFTVSQTNRTGLFGQNDRVEFGMINANTLHFWTNSSRALNATLGPNTNGWRHIAAVKTQTGRLTYIDGRLAAGPLAEAGPVGTGGGNFNIGGGGIFDASGNVFNGKIDDVAVWDTALDADEIQLLADRAVTPLGERTTPEEPGPIVRITMVAFPDPAFEMTAEGLDATRSYILRRSTDGQVFGDVRTPSTGATTHTFVDPSPPARPFPRFGKRPEPRGSRSHRQSKSPSRCFVHREGEPCPALFPAPPIVPEFPPCCSGEQS